MNAIVAIGAAARVNAYRLAGVQVFAAENDGAAREAWTTMPSDTGVLILTREAAAALAGQLAGRPRMLWVTLPS